MIQNAALDVAIGLILMFLMLSLLCSVVNEFIATKLNLRASTLAAALKGLIDDKDLRGRFYDHGLIDGTHQVTGTGFQSLWIAITRGIAAVWGPRNDEAADDAQHPSYLSAQNVALALIGSIDPANPTPGIAEIKQLIDKLPDSNVKSAMQASLTTAGTDITTFRDNVAKWYDDAMDRLSGAYKRKVKWISMLVGLLVAVGVNADSFNVAKRLWADPDLRGTFAAEATKTVQGKDVSSVACGAKSGSQNQAQGSAAQLLDAVSATEDCLRPLPIGWQCGNDTWLVPCVWAHFYGPTADIKLLQVLGWLLTAVAISLGAPFWFDLLSTFVNIRGAGVKPPRQDGTKGAA
jgi:hypothetical protein